MKSQRIEDELTVAVCCVTRKRPRMLERLLTSFESLTLPENCSTLFIVVENNPHETARSQVDAFRIRMQPHDCIYVLQPTLGIPIARNTAIDTALSHEADVILFIDDDEEADRGWLCAMIARYRETDLVLIGGPVRGYVEGLETLSRWKRFLAKGIIQRYRHKAEKAGHLARAGEQGLITIVTNNWLADARLFGEHKIRFDEHLRFTGGSDTRFFHEVNALGLKTGWASDALVTETVPTKRISAAYQFTRAMYQSHISLSNKLRRSDNRPRTVVETIATIVIKSFLLPFLLLWMPIGGGYALISLFRTAGWLVGRIRAPLATPSQFYKAPTGD